MGRNFMRHRYIERIYESNTIIFLISIVFLGMLLAGCGYESPTSSNITYPSSTTENAPNSSSVASSTSHSSNSSESISNSQTPSTDSVSNSGSTGESNSTDGSNSNEGNNINGENDPIKGKIKEMTLKEKLGQLVMVGLDGYSIDDNAKTFISSYKVSGFIFFSRNIESQQQSLELANSLKAFNEDNSNIPLLLGVDEEGGRVSRLPIQYKKLPTNQKIGSINNAEFSREIGEILGQQVNSLGLNLDFAPVMDIMSNPKNTVIGNRSFGNNADVVSSLGLSTHDGIKSQNVIPVIKHFPGHGDTTVDSHVGLPVVTKSLDQLSKLELLPFQAAINNGADVVMVSHILMQKLDSKYPASFSKAIITDLLREKMGFKGVVITDDITMGAVTKNYTLGDMAVKSLQAGSDIILICHDFDKQIEVLNSIISAVKNGEISEQYIDEKVYRVLSLKEKYSVSNSPVASIEVNEINSKLASILQKYVK